MNLPIKGAKHTAQLTIRLPKELKEKAEGMKLNLSEICRLAIQKAVGK